MPTKTCEHCGQTFEKTPAITRFETQRFCSKTCSGAARRLRPPTSTCVVCGATFASRRGRDRANLYCSISCSRRAGPITRPDQTGRSRAQRIYTDGQPCEECGSPFKPGRYGVVRHHRDGDRLNNAPENIAWLCRVDHSKAHGELDQQVGGGARPRIVALLRDRAIDQARAAKALADTGLNHAQIAARLGVERGTVSRWFRKYGADLT